MSADSQTRVPDRARLATAGARAATEAALRQRDRGDRVASIVFLSLLLLGLGVALVALFSILIWALAQGLPRLGPELLTEGPSTIRPESAGFRPAILGSLYVIAGVIVVIIPLGVGAAVYLEEYADNSKWYNRLIDLNIQNLAGVPSIIFGILGLGFIVRGPISTGFVAIAGSLTLAIMVLPTVILASREAIRAVPPSLREGSYALGATTWQTTSRAVLPFATAGILTGVILAVSRALGEAAPLLLVGAVTFVTFDPSFFEGGYSTLPVQIFNYARRPQEAFHVLAAAGVIVMLVLLLSINAFAVWLRNRYEQKW
jgi:phosphate transport system permease protein